MCYSMKNVLRNLKRLADDMSMRTDVSWDELLAVDGMRDTCISAVSTLEDLITFDKLENDILDPVMVTMNAWIFLRDIVRPFRGEVRLMLGIGLDDDIVEDSAVVRRLLCVKNARNTTPPGGTVCITARRLLESE
eukprot:gene16672-34697_t